MYTPLHYFLAALGALGAGLVNALAGGGTLISFPMLTAVIGVPALAANVTNTVALSPGYLGATLAQAKDLRGQRRRLWFVVPAGAAGGIVGGLLLLNTGERLFQDLVPFLILAASVLLAVQEPVRAWLVKRTGARQAALSAARPGQASPTGGSEAWAALPVGLAAVYGGYFGAGLSVIVLAVLGLVLNDTLTRLNALKQAVAFSANIAAALFFLFSGQVVWSMAAVMAVGALLGGALGGRLAGRIKPTTLRGVVVVIGVAVAILYFLR
jgi:uncharacterized membrane protein YfcA